MPDRPFRKLAAKIVFENPWITLEEHQLEVIESGHKFTYTYIAIPPSVMVIAVTPEREIVLVEQYRYPSDRVSFELPGGGSRGVSGPPASIPWWSGCASGGSSGMLPAATFFSMFSKTALSSHPEVWVRR